MIYCKKDELTRYMGLSETLEQAILFVLNSDPESFKMGRNEVSGDDDVYANRFDYETQPAERVSFETHVLYTDLQVMLGGQEIIYVSDPTALREIERREKDDYIGSEGEWQCACQMNAGDVLILFPGEAHKVKCACGAPREVQKLVVKIRA